MKPTGPVISYVEFLIKEIYGLLELLREKNKRLNEASQKILALETKIGDIESSIQAKIALAVLIASSPYFRAVGIGVIDRLVADLVSMGFEDPVEIEAAAHWLELNFKHSPEMARDFLIGKLPFIREAKLELAILEWLMREAGFLKEEVPVTA